MPPVFSSGENQVLMPYEDIEGNFAFSNQGSNEVNSSVEEVSGKEISKIIFDYISANPQCRDGLAILVWTGSLRFYWCP